MTKRNSNILLRGIAINIAILFLYSLLYYYENFYNNWQSFMSLTGILTLINSILFVCCYIRMSAKFFTPFIVLYFSLILFSSGQIILVGLGNKINELTYFWQLSKYNNSVYFEIFYFNLSSIICFQIGFYISKFRMYHLKKKITIDLNLKKYIPYIFLLAGGCAILINLMFAVKSRNYADIYNQSYGKFYNILLGISNFTIPCYLLMQYNNSKTNKKKSTFFLILIVCICLVIGRRSSAIMYLVIIFFCNYKSFGKLNLKNIAFLIVMGYFLFTMLYTVSITRIVDFSISMLVTSFFENLISFTSVKYMIVEMGSSIRPLIEIINQANVGTIELKHGISYIYSLFLILPGFLRFGFDDIAINEGIVNLSSVITSLSGANYGLGSSPQMEAYYNFGFCGFLFFLFLGWGIGVLLDRDLFREKKYSFLFQVCVLAFIIIFPRSPMQDTLKKLIYYCILPFVINMKMQRKKEIDV